MNEFIAPIVTLTGLGIFFAIVLSWASKKFAVIQDERITQIIETLPGANCGACGVAGCSRFAEAVVQGEAAIEKCKVCSEDDALKIAKLLGVVLTKTEKKVATLHCHGGKKAKDKYEYRSVEQCHAAVQLMQGPKVCGFACMGFGDCKRSCVFGAIKMGFDGLPVIDEELCSACGKCIEACPRHLMMLIPEKVKVFVGCNSHDPAKVIIKACTAGCIACKKCEKECPVDAIKVIDNLAVIDYEKCTSCGKCVDVCPRKIILRRKK